MPNLKKSFLLSLFLLKCITFFGQKAYLSEAFKTKINEKIEVIGQLSEFSFFSVSSEYDFKILRLNAEMKNQQILTIPLDERRAEVIYTGFINKMIAVVYKYRHKSDLCVKMLTYDTRLNFRDSSTIACFNTPNFNIQTKVILSDDKHSLLLYFNHLTDYMQFWSFNMKEKKLNWSYRWDYELEKTEYRYFEKLLLDNDGNAVLVFNEPKSGKNNFSLTLAYLTNVGVSKYELADQHYKLYDTDWLIDNKNRRLLQTGLIMEEKGFRPTGSIYRRISLPFLQDSTFTSTSTFDTAKITAYDKNIEKYAEDLNELSMVSVLLKQDGGVVLLLEKQLTNERSIKGRMLNTGNTMRNLTDYYFDDIYVLSINVNGTIEWLAPMPKRQFSQDDDADFSSFLLLKNSDFLRLVFNDEITNDNTLSQYLLHADGSFERKNIPNSDFRKLKIMFRKGRQVNAGTVLIPCLFKNKTRFLKLEF